MDLVGFKEYVNAVNWVFAKTYAKKSPHWYTLRAHRSDLIDSFHGAVLFIRKFGIEERYFSMRFVCFYFEGHKYWTMGAPVYETILINRTDFSSCQRFDITWKPQKGYADKDYHFEDELTETEVKAAFSGIDITPQSRSKPDGQSEMELWL